MEYPLVTSLLPLLTEPARPEFNIFQVLHHGTHERQISNLFAWLLSPDGTHQLGESFQRLFIDEINHSKSESTSVEYGPYSVRQEVNTAPPDGDRDIADIVLESPSTIIVVENYHVSDGHGHSYHRYREFGSRRGKTAVVVMLCASATPGSLTDGWQEAAVVTYGSLIDLLGAHVKADEEFREANPQQCFFFEQIHTFFVKGRNVNSSELIDFIRAVCNSGSAVHYRQSPELSAVNFADALRERALVQFAESRDLLGRVKANLLAYANGSLIPQINGALGQEYLTNAAANYRGIFQWTVILHSGVAGEGSDPPLQIKFGPSAWYAVEEDSNWSLHSKGEIDYAHLFLTERSTMSVVQSSVTIRELLSGLTADDLRLRDELLALTKR